VIFGCQIFQRLGCHLYCNSFLNKNEQSFKTGYWLNTNNWCQRRIRDFSETHFWECLRISRIFFFLFFRFQVCPENSRSILRLFTWNDDHNENLALVGGLCTSEIFTLIYFCSNLFVVIEQFKLPYKLTRAKTYYICSKLSIDDR